MKPCYNWIPTELTESDFKGLIMKLIYSSILTLSTLCLAPSVIASNPPGNQSSSLVVNEKRESHQGITDRKIIGLIMAVDKSEIAAANGALKKNVNTSVPT